MRILVTASRDWTDKETIHRQLLEHVKGNRDVTIVHGDCPIGGDQIADEFAEKNGWIVERHPAEWERYGSAAGPIRNTKMVRQGAHICLAFIKDNSRGATGCANLAEKARILTVRIYG